MNNLDGVFLQRDPDTGALSPTVPELATLDARQRAIVVAVRAALSTQRNTEHARNRGTVYEIRRHEARAHVAEANLYRMLGIDPELVDAYCLSDAFISAFAVEMTQAARKAIPQ